MKVATIVALGGGWFGLTHLQLFCSPDLFFWCILDGSHWELNKKWITSKNQMKNQSNSNIQRKKNTILTMSYNKEGITTPLNYHHDEKLMRISPQFKSNTKMQRAMKENKNKKFMLEVHTKDSWWEWMEFKQLVKVQMKWCKSECKLRQIGNFNT